jgi:tetratricopeptide (TPR) repeat protein
MKLSIGRAMKLFSLGVLGIAAAGLIWLGIANLLAGRRLEAQLADLRAAGEPTSLAELARKPIEPEANAATYLRQATNDLMAIEKQVEAALDAATAEQQEHFHDRHHATPPVYEATQSAFASHAGAVPLLEKAAACPHYDPQLDYSKGPQQFIEQYVELSQDVRQPIRVLNYRVVMLLAQGKHDEALQTCTLMFRLIRHLDDRPLLINYLVTLAVRGVAVGAANTVLRSGPLPATAYQALETELARHDLVATRQMALRTDRAYGIDQFAEFHVMVGYMMLPWGKDDETSYLKLLEAKIQNAGLPYHDSQSRARARAILDGAGPLTRLMEPVLDASSEATAQTNARLRALRVLNSILQREQAGEMGEVKLADLGLPAEATADAYNGKPLIVKKRPDGWLIYSVGPNQTDDDGKLDDHQTDVGVGPISRHSARAE